MKKLERLTSFEGLGIGDKVTEVTINGFKVYEYMGGDPKLKKPEDKNNYGYFLDSFGRVKAERWYIDSLERKSVYIGYDNIFVVKRQIELLKLALATLEQEMEMVYEEENKKTI